MTDQDRAHAMRTRAREIYARANLRISQGRRTEALQLRIAARKLVRSARELAGPEPADPRDDLGRCGAIARGELVG